MHVTFPTVAFGYFILRWPCYIVLDIYTKYEAILINNMFLL